MTSALFALANATAVFILPTVGVITDPSTGNVLPAQDAATVTLYLRQASPQPAGLEGVDTDTIICEGYAVEPQALDARIRPGTRGTVTMSGREMTCEVLQERFPYGSTGLLGTTLQTILGDRIRLAAYLHG
tara:strand:- start:485 stop:877 length:393 start_codon:yes stop_codon:yes gene_type:complete